MSKAHGTPARAATTEGRPTSFRIERSGERRRSLRMGRLPLGFVFRTAHAEQHGINRGCFAATTLRGRVVGRGRSVEAVARRVWGAHDTKFALVAARDDSAWVAAS